MAEVRAGTAGDGGSHGGATGARGPLRIGNCSGFLGDRLAAMREMLQGGPLDVLTGDYLAELTMLILYRSRLKDPTKGYAGTFLRQLEDCLGMAAERGVKIVVNAGGLNPAGCAAAVRQLSERLGVPTRVAHVEGDDLMPRLRELRTAGVAFTHVDTGAALTATPVSANAYLGAWGITAALSAGAEVVVTGRVTDASLVVGPAAWHHGWARDNWDALAGAVVAGHVLECGTQATGGNYAFFTEIADLRRPGFPIADVHADGSSVISKHPGSGGAVSIGTVTAQLLYEIGGPRYLGPDVTARFDTIELSEDGPDRVGISGVRGEPPPAQLKACLNLVGGLRNSVTFLLTGLDLDAKVGLLLDQLAPVLRDVEHAVAVQRSGHEDPVANEDAISALRITVKGDDPAAVGRAFSSACVEAALASYPGFTLTAPPGDATPYGVFWPALIDRDHVSQVVVLADGTRLTVPDTAAGDVPARLIAEADRSSPLLEGATTHAPLGQLVGARSGDKGGNANLGVWTRTDAAYDWLVGWLVVEKLKDLLPECAPLVVERFVFPRLRAVNFVLVGLLGEGVSSSTRIDPQAKGLGEWLRARYADIPTVLL